MRNRRRILAPFVALAIIVAVCAVGAVGAQTSPTFNVRNYGALGNGSTNDTAAIQKANDAAFRAGGGTVYFPAGTYSAAGIRQDANVHFLGATGATLRHRTGSSATPILMSRLRRTNGHISAGATTLTVASAYGIVPGAILGVRAAGGPSEVQKTTLRGAAIGGLVMIDNTQGWRRNVRNYLWVGNEVISYKGISGNSLQSVRRGLFGTAVATHQAGTRVSQAQGLYARVVSVAGKTITLDRPAMKTVRYAHVWTGAVNMSLSGLTIDGKRPANPTASNSLVGVRYDQARWVRVENNTFVRSAHGGVALDVGTSDSRIVNNVFLDNGNPGDRMGSAVWLYRGASSNTVENNHIGGDAFYGVAVDDRTDISTEWDAPSDDNIIQYNWIEVPPVDGQAGIFVSGSNRNRLVGNDVLSTKRGIAIVRSTQGINPGDSEGNSVEGNRLGGHSWGLHATGSYNSFVSNLVEATEYPIVDQGIGNSFS